MSEAEGSASHRTLAYYYTKYQYKKVVKRLHDDPSSMWFDNLEQMRKDYADLKEVYDLICAPKPPPASQVADEAEEAKSRGGLSTRKHQALKKQAAERKR